MTGDGAGQGMFERLVHQSAPKPVVSAGGGEMEGACNKMIPARLTADRYLSTLLTRILAPNCNYAPLKSFPTSISYLNN